MTTALLLAAGKATRLGALRDQYAKACVPIADTTPLRFAMQQLAAAGVTRFVVNLHWQAEQVREAARAAAPTGTEVEFLFEETLLGTGGTVLACRERFGALPDLVLNAKQFSDLDFERVLRSAAGTLVLHRDSPLSTFGGLAFSAADQLVGLVARNHPQAWPDGAVDAAVYTGICRPDPAWLPFLEADAEAARAQGKPLCLARSGLLAAAQARIAVPVLVHAGLWCEISTPERVQEAEALVRQLAAAGSDQSSFGVA